MVEWIGIVCVVWTATELLRMSAAAAGAHADAAATEPHGRSGARDTAPKARTRSRRFAAWDDRGRPIEVEDLGPARPRDADA